MCEVWVRVPPEVQLSFNYTMYIMYMCIYICKRVCVSSRIRCNQFRFVQVCLRSHVECYIHMYERNHWSDDEIELIHLEIHIVNTNNYVISYKWNSDDYFSLRTSNFKKHNKLCTIIHYSTSESSDSHVPLDQRPSRTA